MIVAPSSSTKTNAEQRTRHSTEHDRISRDSWVLHENPSPSLRSLYRLENCLSWGATNNAFGRIRVVGSQTKTNQRSNNTRSIGFKHCLKRMRHILLLTTETKHRGRAGFETGMTVLLAFVVPKIRTTSTATYNLRPRRHYLACRYLCVLCFNKRSFASFLITRLESIIDINTGPSLNTNMEIFPILAYVLRTSDAFLQASSI